MAMEAAEKLAAQEARKSAEEAAVKEAVNKARRMEAGE